MSETLDVCATCGHVNAVEDCDCTDVFCVCDSARQDRVRNVREARAVTPKAAVYKRVKTLGAHLDFVKRGDGLVTICIEAPRGQHWIDGRIHEIRAEGYPTTPALKDDLWSDTLARMNAGLDPCRGQCEYWE